MCEHPIGFLQGLKVMFNDCHQAVYCLMMLTTRNFLTVHCHLHVLGVPDCSWLNCFHLLRNCSIIADCFEEVLYNLQQ